MSEPSLHSQVQDVFRQVFQDETLEITPSMSAADLEDWDSLAHLNLVVAAEHRFDVRFLLAELNQLRKVRDFESLIADKLSARSDR